MEQTQLRATDTLTYFVFGSSINMATMRMDLQGQENGKPERDFDAGTGNVACT
jgi:hypothetical protein